VESDIVKEVVLPSGRFAAFRKLRFGDFVISHDDNPHAMLAKLAEQTVTLDGEPISFEQIMEMDAGEFFPISKVLSDFMCEAMSTQNGIA